MERTYTSKILHTPIGDMLAVASEDGIHQLEFVEGSKNAGHITLTDVSEGSTKDLEELEKQLTEYFNGKRKEFDLPLVAFGSAFQQNAWQALLDIPYGETISYKEEALHAGNEKAVRAVGHANGANAIAIVIPCHRVIGSNGKLGGYGGGLWRKQWLLDHERSHNK
jgi:O-6-methylguanine DNA methyltransferase